MDDIKIGDVVTLKSGSPLMTVSHVMPDGDLLCLWFGDEIDTSHILSQGYFSALALDLYEEEEDFTN